MDCLHNEAAFLARGLLASHKGGDVRLVDGQHTSLVLRVSPFHLPEHPGQTFWAFGLAAVCATGNVFEVEGIKATARSYAKLVSRQVTQLSYWNFDVTDVHITCNTSHAGYRSPAGCEGPAGHEQEHNEQEYHDQEHCVPTAIDCGRHSLSATSKPSTVRPPVLARRVTPTVDTESQRRTSERLSRSGRGATEAETLARADPTTSGGYPGKEKDSRHTGTSKEVDPVVSITVIGDAQEPAKPAKDASNAQKPAKPVTNASDAAKPAKPTKRASELIDTVVAAIVAGGQTWQSDPHTRLEWEQDLERQKPTNHCVKPEELTMQCRHYASSVESRSWQATFLYGCALILRAEKHDGRRKRTTCNPTKKTASCYETRLARFVIELINGLFTSARESAFNIIPALSASPVRITRTCFRDVTHPMLKGLAEKTAVCLLDRDNASWRQIDHRHVFDPARLLSSATLSYTAVRKRLNLTATPSSLRLIPAPANHYEGPNKHAALSETFGYEELAPDAAAHGLEGTVAMTDVEIQRRSGKDTRDGTVPWAQYPMSEPPNHYLWDQFMVDEAP